MATEDGSHSSVLVTDTGRLRRFAGPGSHDRRRCQSSHASREVSKTMMVGTVGLMLAHDRLAGRAVDFSCTALTVIAQLCSRARERYVGAGRACRWTRPRRPAESQEVASRGRGPCAGGRAAGRRVHQERTRRGKPRASGARARRADIDRASREIRNISSPSRAPPAEERPNAVPVPIGSSMMLRTDGRARAPRARRPPSGLRPFVGHADRHGCGGFHATRGREHQGD